MELDRIWLDVPYDEKDAAKALGAKWDPQRRRWYAPRVGMVGLDRWTAQPDVPVLLPGEDRSFGSGLFVDLVPSSCWFTNVRSCVVQKDWERLRRMITERANDRCEACGRTEDRDRRRWLEAHERWHFDDVTRVQTLKRLICLCTDCHTVTHFGLAQVKGKSAEAMAHLRFVTKMTPWEAEEHVANAFAVWRARSRSDWTLDLRILTNAGIALSAPPAAERRAAVAHQALREVRGSERAGEIQPPPRAAPVSKSEASSAELPASRSGWSGWFRRR